MLSMRTSQNNWKENYKTYPDNAVFSLIMGLMSHNHRLGKVNKNKSLVPILVQNRLFLICIHNNLQAPRIRDSPTYEFQCILEIFQILMQWSSVTLSKIMQASYPSQSNHSRSFCTKRISMNFI